MFTKRPGCSLIALPLVFLLIAPTSLVAQTGPKPPADQGQAELSEPPPSLLNRAGYGALAVAANVPYIPMKLMYAAISGVSGALTWLLTAGSAKSAKTAWRIGMGGDYVVTPSMMRGDEPINFSGPEEEPGAPKPSSQLSAPTLSVPVPAGTAAPVAGKSK